MRYSQSGTLVTSAYFLHLWIVPRTRTCHLGLSRIHRAKQRGVSATHSLQIAYRSSALSGTTGNIQSVWRNLRLWSLCANVSWDNEINSMCRIIPPRPHFLFYLLSLRPASSFTPVNTTTPMTRSNALCQISCHPEAS